MCIVSVAWQAHPDWPLVAIGNRDELHARSSRPLSRWGNTDHVLAGQDAQAGGTWMGISEEGRFAVVTNVAQNNAPNQSAASRGALLKDFLNGTGPFSDVTHVNLSQFNALNLLTIDHRSAAIHTNRPEGRSHKIKSGVYGLSNGLIETPWSKSAKLNTALEHWLIYGSSDYTKLLNILSDPSPVSPTDEIERPDEIVPPPEHSGLFIENPVYGTRCSSVIAVKQNGDGIFMERSYSADAKTSGEVTLDFSWPG